MERRTGTISRGIRCPIFREGDNVADIVVKSVLEAAECDGFEIRDRDVICVTESVVARAQGNYAPVSAISKDVKKKLGGKTIGVIFPILSRNRFAICLKGIAGGAEKVVLMLSYPSDEVGNALVSLDQLDEKEINPYSDVLTLEKYRELFGETVIDTAQRLASEMPATGQRSRAVMAKAIAEELASRKMSPEQAAYVRANPQVIAASPIRETLEKQAGVEAQPRIFPTLKPEYAPKQEEPAHEEPKAIITMIPRGENVLDFQKFISRKLVEAARKSSDETVRKLADVLALIDEYEGERRCSEGTESQVA